MPLRPGPGRPATPLTFSPKGSICRPAHLDSTPHSDDHAPPQPLPGCSDARVSQEESPHPPLLLLSNTRGPVLLSLGFHTRRPRLEHKARFGMKGCGLPRPTAERGRACPQPSASDTQGGKPLQAWPPQAGLGTSYKARPRLRPNPQQCAWPWWAWDRRLRESLGDVVSESPSCLRLL